MTEAQQALITVIDTPVQMLKTLKELTTWAEDLHLAYAWISSGNGNAEHWRMLSLNKVRRAIIGIQFAQTDPGALRQLARHPERLRVVNDPDGIFHPKVILGIKEGEGRALVGSSNFTVGGFGGNTELNLLLEGSLAIPPLADILRFIDVQWQSVRAFQPDPAWISRYTDAYMQRPKPPRVSSVQPATIIDTASDLDIPWSRYFQLIAEQERRTLADGTNVRIFEHPHGSYLQEVENCRAAFEAYPSFADMPLESRQMIAGWGGKTYGWFGRMTAAGEFKKMTGETPNEVIADNLDAIPLEGPIPEVLFNTVLNGMLMRRTGIATVSRLLTVKRPDFFLSCNNANKSRIKHVFGFNPLTQKRYVELHQQIWSFPWFNSPQPDGVEERKVWHARVALLDALLYDG